MLLHENLNEFKQTIESTAKYYNLEESFIEKDYYVTLIINALKDCIPGLLFKGGTCLSKCFNLIDRFSEDIDLTLDLEHFTQSNKRKANKMIIKTCEDLKFNILNIDKVINHSHANYNLYQIEYPSLFKFLGVKPFIQVEITFIQRAYPDVKMPVSSYVIKWLEAGGNHDVCAEYELKPFEIKAQALERTFVDKVFALCDYYLRKTPIRNSRHIYDLNRLLTKIDINNNQMIPLINKVREDRKKNKTSVSAQDNVNINSVLAEIIQTRYFEQDYNESTKLLLTKPCEYKDVIGAIQTIIDSKLFV